MSSATSHWESSGVEEGGVASTSLSLLHQPQLRDNNGTALSDRLTRFCRPLDAPTTKPQSIRASTSRDRADLPPRTSPYPYHTLPYALLRPISPQWPNSLLISTTLRLTRGEPTWRPSTLVPFRFFAGLAFPADLLTSNSHSATTRCSPSRPSSSRAPLPSSRSSSCVFSSFRYLVVLAYRHLSTGSPLHHDHPQGLHRRRPAGSDRQGLHDRPCYRPAHRTLFSSFSPLVTPTYPLLTTDR